MRRYACSQNFLIQTFVLMGVCSLFWHRTAGFPWAQCPFVCSGCVLPRGITRLHVASGRRLSVGVACWVVSVSVVCLSTGAAVSVPESGHQGERGGVSDEKV